MNTDSNNIRGPLKILLVEDNADIQESTQLIFELHWPEARLMQAFAGLEALEMIKKLSPELIILDLGLPDIDGMKVLKQIREMSDVPVIILTVRGEETDKVRGLELGADDYIVKPFSHKELLARIRVVMGRRNHKVTADSAPLSPSSILKINLATGEILKAEKPVKLTGTELSLLKYMAAHEGRMLADEDILREIWGSEYTDCSEYLEAYVRRLRDKLEDDPFRPKVLLRENNGYRFTQNVNQ